MLIAEIGRAVGADERVERVGSHWSPSGIGQTRAGFHHDDKIAGAGDGEPKLVRSHAERGTLGLNLRIPQLGRKSVKHLSPARCPRQIINGRFDVSAEHSRIIEGIRYGSVTFEIDSCQIGATRKRIASETRNACSALGNRDAGQVGTVLERLVSDADDSVGNRDVGQAAVKKCRLSDNGDTGGDYYAGQGTISERLCPNGGNTVGNRDAGQVRATIKCKVTDTGDTGGKHDTGQAVTETECSLPDICNAIENRDARQAGGLERVVPDAGDTTGNRDAG